MWYLPWQISSASVHIRTQPSSSSNVHDACTRVPLVRRNSREGFADSKSIWRAAIARSRLPNVLHNWLAGRSGEFPGKFLVVYTLRWSHERALHEERVIRITLGARDRNEGTAWKRQKHQRVDFTAISQEIRSGKSSARDAPWNLDTRVIGRRRVADNIEFGTRSSRLYALVKSIIWSKILHSRISVLSFSPLFFFFFSFSFFSFFFLSPFRVQSTVRMIIPRRFFSSLLSFFFSFFLFCFRS